MAITQGLPGTRPLRLRELLAQIRGEAGALVRDFCTLAEREVVERARGVVPIVVLTSAAACAALVGVLGLGAAAVLALARVLPAWGAALVVALAALAAAGIACAVARQRLRQLDLRPRETLRALQKGLAWLDQSM
jgi:hypothetical protein